MQENTEVQFCHPETAGEPPLSAIYDMQENTAALFFLHLQYSRRATTSTKRDSEITKLPKVAERIPYRAEGIHCQKQCRAMASAHSCGLFIGGYEAA